MPPVLAGTAIVLASGCIEARDTRATARTRSGGDGWERGERRIERISRHQGRPSAPHRLTEERCEARDVKLMQQMHMTAGRR